jgi:drug/metabolite transporter (DMT)-like permease
MSRKVEAVLLMLLSALSFALMGACVKFLADISVYQKVFFRNLVTLIITMTIFMIRRENPIKKEAAVKVLLARSFTGLAGVFCFFYALSNISLADASMLNKLSPVFVLIFAWIFLKEKLSIHKWIVIGISLIGAVLIIKPGFNLTLLPFLSGLFSSICAGAAYTMVRSLKGKASPEKIIFYFSAISVLGTLPFMLNDFTIPNFSQLLGLIGTGVFAAGGQYGLTLAYHKEQASEISIYSYMNILFAGVIGWMFWGEIQDIYSILGSLLIICGAVYSFTKRNRG